jgi:hypothetical protein
MLTENDLLKIKRSVAKIIGAEDGHSEYKLLQSDLRIASWYSEDGQSQHYCWELTVHNDHDHEYMEDITEYIYCLLINEQRKYDFHCTHLKVRKPPEFSMEFHETILRLRIPKQYRYIEDEYV